MSWIAKHWQKFETWAKKNEEQYERRHHIPPRPLPPCPAPQETQEPSDDLVTRLHALHIIDEVYSDNSLGREAAAEIVALRKTIERLQVDAERYQWIRDSPDAIKITGVYFSYFELDATVDTARVGYKNIGGLTE